MFAHFFVFPVSYSGLILKETNTFSSQISMFWCLLFRSVYFVLCLILFFVSNYVLFQADNKIFVRTRNTKIFVCHHVLPYLIVCFSVKIVAIVYTQFIRLVFYLSMCMYSLTHNTISRVTHTTQFTVTLNKSQTRISKVKYVFYIVSFFTKCIRLNWRHMTLLRRFLLNSKFIQVIYSFVIKYLKYRKLSVGLLNPGSLGNKHEEFLVAMDRHDVDIMAINETWLREGEDARAPAPPGYRLRHAPRPPGARSRGGGVGFYIKRGINARLIDHPHAQSVEQMWLSLNISGYRLAIGTAYRPQWLDVDVFIDALTESISSLGKYDKVLLLGDFNINILNSLDVHTRKLLDFFSCMNLTQYVDQPTHFTEHSETLIDVICSDSQISQILVDYIPDLSRHAFITCKLNIRKDKPPPKWLIYRPLKNINLEKFNDDVNSLPWDNFDSGDVNTMVERFNDNVKKLFDKHAPVRRVYFKSHSHPWITHTVKEMIKLRDKAHARSKLTSLETHKAYYRELKAVVNSAIHTEKSAYFKANINNHSGDARMLWKNIKRDVVDFKKKNFELPSHLNSPDIINSNFLDVPGNDDADASVLNDLKSSKFSSAVFTLKPVSETVVSNIIRKIKTNAQGVDGITINMILLTLPRTLKAITAIVNRSIETGVFPQQWKIAIVRPVPKTKHPNEYKDLRPISILPCLSKIVERAICMQMTDFLELNKILPQKQSGFRKRHSTSTALLDVVDDILVAQDSGESTILVLLDYSRAFDTINPTILLAKLAYYGFDSLSLKWFTSYLTERIQYVETRHEDGSVSSSTKSLVPRGVPQGSILGPLLFILYTADIVDNIINCKYHLYADDLQLYISFKPEATPFAVAKLNEDLNRVSTWSDRQNLVLNPVKSKYMIFGTKNSIIKVTSHDPQVSMMGKRLDNVSQVRNLGIVMDENLKFEGHILEIVRNCFYRLKVLYRVRNYIDVETRIKLCESLVLSKLNYGDTVFGGCLLERTKRMLQRIQNACARFCFPVPRRSHITPFLNRNNLLNMSARRKLHIASLLFEVIKSQEPAYLYNKLNFSQRRVRIAPRLMCCQHRTAAFRGSFRYAATKCWNNLPPPIRNCRSTSTFKHLLKNFLFDEQISAT